MRLLTFLLVIAGLPVLFVNPALADRRDNYMDDRLDYWTDYAEDLGYDIMETEIDSISSYQNLHFYLSPGTYHAYAEGCSRIEDLDMIAYDHDGWELDSDNMSDNFPIVTFTIWDWEEVEFEISVYSYNERTNRGYFCFVLARERDFHDEWGRRPRDNWNDWDDCDDWDDNDHWNDYGNYNDNWHSDQYWYDWRDDWDSWWGDWDNGDWDCHGNSGWSNNERRQYIEYRLDGLTEFAYHRRLYPVMDDIDIINGTRTYSMTLQRGYYVIFAAGGPWIDDLDLHVTSHRGRQMAEDIDLDASPAVWCYLPNRTTINIEVEVWSFSDRHFDDYFCLLVCEG